MQSETEEPPHIVLTWEKVVECVSTIACLMKLSGFTPKRIIALAKGGIVPGGLLLQHFPDAEFQAIRVISYTPEGKVCPYASKRLPRSLNGPNTLVIDDICDSGDTFNYVMAWLPTVTFASLLWREGSPFAPEYTGELVGPGWVDFPWENQHAPAS